MNESCPALYFNSSYFCPRGEFGHECAGDYRSWSLSKETSYVALTSSSLSVLGSLLIIFSYWKWKDIRTGSRSIVTYLAIADFFTAAGYIMGSINFITYYNYPDDTYDCVDFVQICRVQSLITTWSSMSSFVWTAYLATYLYLTIVHGRNHLANNLIPLVHVIAWVCPFVVTYALLITKWLGQSRVGASSWCFIRQYHDHLTISPKTTVISLMAGKLWEVLTYLLICVLYVLSKCYIRKERRRVQLSEEMSTALQSINRKMTFIPVVFILLRMWGTVEFYYIITESAMGKVNCGCVTKSVSRVLAALGYLQAIGDGGQGWANAILFVFLSAKLRGRFLGCLCRPLVHWFLVNVKKRDRVEVNFTAGTSHTNTNKLPINSSPYQRMDGPRQSDRVLVHLDSGSANFVPQQYQGNGQPQFEQTTEFSCTN